jgi:4-hydroxy-2-oxoheptanedioate aldolase
VTDTLKQRLLVGKKQLGVVMLLPSPDVAEIVAQTGIDVAMIDHEHGCGYLQDFIAQDRAIRGSAMAAMVRVPHGELTYAQRLLDNGCRAVVFPGIDTAEQAREVVQACFYPPRGHRGAGGGLRGANHGLDNGYYTPAAEDGTLIVAQIESAAAVDNIDAICAVEGIDMLLIGPRDLSATLGKLGQLSDPGVRDRVDHAAARIKAAGKLLACTLLPGKTVREMFDEGFDLVLAGKEVDFLIQGGQALAALK